jgi:hypothetical protein
MIQDLMEILKNTKSKISNKDEITKMLKQIQKEVALE